MINVFIAFLIAASPMQKQSVSPHFETTVYICSNGKTSVYHVSKTCNAVKRCTHDILQVSETDAIKKYHLRKCKICSK